MREEVKSLMQPQLNSTTTKAHSGKLKPSYLAARGLRGTNRATQPMEGWKCVVSSSWTWR